MKINQQDMKRVEGLFGSLMGNDEQPELKLDQMLIE